MSWLNPGGLWWLILIPLLLALYVLRPRPRQRQISSFRLWTDLPQIERPRSRLRRPPLSLLMIVQLALLAIGVVAILRPALTRTAGEHQVVLIDASGSMQASDGTSSRFEQARAKAHELVANLGGDDVATLMRVSTQVTTLCNACAKADFETSLDAMQPGAGHADWGTAFSLANLLQAGESRRIAYTVISDGAYDSLSAANLPGAVNFVAVGALADNRAITVLSAQRPVDGSAGYNAYSRIENSSATTATITVAASADTVPLPQRKVTIPAGGNAELLWPLPVGTVRFTVQLSPPDALTIDDSAALFLPAEAEHEVYINSTQPDLYRRVLVGMPSLNAITDTVALTTTPELTIIEGALPNPLPKGSLMLVNPTGDLLPVRGELADVRPLVGDLPHPLVGNLDLRSLRVTKAKQIDAPSWLEPVISAADGPLVLAGTHDGGRVVVFTFDPRDSNLPQLATFPLLMANLIDWLDPLAAGGAIEPGDVLPLAPGTGVEGPDGQTVTIGDAGLFTATDAAGVYKVSRSGRQDLFFAVNATDALESNLAPRAHPELTRADTAQAQQAGVPQEIWEPLALIVLLLVGADWLVYCWKRGQA